MAWNEPGNNDKDPWKKKGDKNQGPPDLDDLLKDIGNKVGGIFGGKSSNGGSSKGASSVGIVIALIVGILVYGFSGFYTIKEAALMAALIITFNCSFNANPSASSAMPSIILMPFSNSTYSSFVISPCSRALLYSMI